MYDSLNPPPLPAYRIPIRVTIDGQEKSGYLRPVDNYDPTRSFMVMLDEKWFCMLHFFKPGWQVDNKDYPWLAEELGDIVAAWWQ